MRNGKETGAVPSWLAELNQKQASTERGSEQTGLLPWEAEGEEVASVVAAPVEPLAPPLPPFVPPPLPPALPVQVTALAPANVGPLATRTAASGAALHDLKGRVHRKLLERLNLTQLDALEREQVLGEVRKVVHELMQKEPVPLNLDEREELVSQVLDEIFGFGPLEPLLKDDDTSDILVNGCHQVYVEMHGKLFESDVRFKDDRHLLQIIDRIVSGVGRRIDESTPLVDARLPDGSRVNAIIPPLALDGPALSIRKFKRDKLAAEDLVRLESITEPMVELLQGIVRARLNILISGGTGAGKTTLLNLLSSFIPSDERIVTIEDSAELQLRQPHVVRLETRPANVEGQGAVSQRMLLINALRMRPDRVVVGEVRGGEAIDMLQAMNTGHDGSIATLHANSPRDALGRLETMISMANLNLPERAMRQQIASAVDVVIQVSRLSDGKRKVMNISEVVGMEGEVITMQEVFLYDRQGISEDGQVIGRFRPTGIRPKFADRLKAYGITLPATMFSDMAARGGGQW
jgi:pilus assembly protein CpaF